VLNNFFYKKILLSNKDNPIDTIFFRDLFMPSPLQKPRHPSIPDTTLSQPQKGLAQGESLSEQKTRYFVQRYQAEQKEYAELQNHLCTTNHFPMSRWIWVHRKDSWFCHVLVIFCTCFNKTLKKLLELEKNIERDSKRYTQTVTASGAGSGNISIPICTSERITSTAAAMADITSAATHVATFTSNTRLAYEEAQALSKKLLPTLRSNIVGASAYALDITLKALAARQATIEACHYFRYATAKAQGRADPIVDRAKTDEDKAKRYALESYALAKSAIATATALIDQAAAGTPHIEKARRNIEQARAKLEMAKRAADEDEISEKLAASFLCDTSVTDHELAAFLAARDYTTRTDVLMGIYTRLNE
jgi:hypothetical protein